MNNLIFTSCNVNPVTNNDPFIFQIDFLVILYFNYFYEKITTIINSWIFNNMFWSDKKLSEDRTSRNLQDRSKSSIFKNATSPDPSLPLREGSDGNKPNRRAVSVNS